jgi:organic radical activating enzyme
MDTGQWKETHRQALLLGVSSFGFTGGEPLLRDDCLDLVEYALDRTVELVEQRDGELAGRPVRPDVTLLSNGRAVDSRVLERLRNSGCP